MDNKGYISCDCRKVFTRVSMYRISGYTYNVRTETFEYHAIKVGASYVERMMAEHCKGLQAIAETIAHIRFLTPDNGRRLLPETLNIERVF